MLRRLARWTAALAVIVILGACASPYGHNTQPADAFNESEAVDVFDVGFSNILARALEPISARTFAVEGLRGLGSIDPALTAEADETEVRVLVRGVVVAREPAPANDDPSAWARASGRLISKASVASDDLRLAGAERIFETVFDGAIAKLDIYSRYAGAAEARRNRAKRDGFGGIGIRFQREDDVIVVTRVTPGTPAERAGVRIGDQLVRVDGRLISKLTLADVVDLLRGPIGTQVSIVVAPASKTPLTQMAIERAHIVQETVAERRTDGIVFYKIDSFNQDTARALSDGLRQARADLGPRLRGVVLDLRGNPGGLLRQSIQVADVFLGSGRIISTRGRHPDSHQIYDAETGDESAGVPLVVLVDGKSASAAEIVASALKDRARAVVIGTSSYGKGTVQTVIRLPNDGELTLTWSRLITPNGRVLHGVGVIPSICTANLDSDLNAETERDALESAARFATSMSGNTPLQTRRAVCPAERRDKDLEIRLARKLLDRPDIYARLREGPAATAEALPGS